MQRYEPFSIEIAGRRYNATWHIEGRDLCVSSAYGSGKAAIARAKPENVAAKVLRDLVTGSSKPLPRREALSDGDQAQAPGPAPKT